MKIFPSLMRFGRFLNLYVYLWNTTFFFWNAIRKMLGILIRNAACLVAVQCAWPWLWLCRMNESWSCTARTTTRRWGSQTKPFSRHFVREYHLSYCIQFVHCTVVYYHYMLICPTLPHSSLFYCIVFPLLPFPLPHIFFLFFPAHLLSSKFLSYDFLLF